MPSMKLRWFAVGVGVVAVAAGLGLGCSRVEDESPSSELAPRPGLATLRAALSEPDELERTYLLTSFLRSMQPEDIEQALAEIEEHRAGFDKEEVRLFMLAWTRFDGAGAFRTASEWPTQWKSVLMEQAMYAWGFNDGRAAMAACEKIEDEDLRETLREALMSGWVASRDRLGASEYAAGVVDARRRNRLAFRLAGEAKREGVDAVIAWADAVPVDAPNGFKESTFVHAGGVIARMDPQRVTSWYERHMKEPYTATCLRNIASKWAQYHDVEMLLAWLESLPIEEARELERADAVQTAFRIWAAAAPRKAEAWLELASSGPSKDRAIDEYARATVETSPAGAVRWVEEIEDPELRRRRTLRYTRRWFVQDAEAARAWLDAAEIPDEWRQQVLNNLPHANRPASSKKPEPGA
jgi:hypothetical protein